MQFIVVDLEATCWESERSYRTDQKEIIEIGAVRLDETFAVVDEFASFVRPVAHRELSDFCIELTTITQADVDAADPFVQVFPQFLGWIGDQPSRLCSWGFYDVGQFRLDCRRSGLAFPEWFEDQHINVKSEFATWRGVKRCGMEKALEHLGMPLTGTHHRGIDDARNIAAIGQQVLPDLML